MEENREPEKEEPVKEYKVGRRILTLMVLMVMMVMMPEKEEPVKEYKVGRRSLIIYQKEILI